MLKGLSVLSGRTIRLPVLCIYFVRAEPYFTLHLPFFSWSAHPCYALRLPSLRHTDLSQMCMRRRIHSACYSQVPTGGSAVHKQTQNACFAGSLLMYYLSYSTPAPCHICERIHNSPQYDAVCNLCNLKREAIQQRKFGKIAAFVLLLAVRSQVRVLPAAFAVPFVPSFL